MVKALKYLLSFCILLLGGYSQLHAHPHAEGIHHVTVRNYSRPGHICICMAQKCETVYIKPDTSATPGKDGEKRNQRVLFENEEVDEITSLKKYLKGNNLVFNLLEQVPAAVSGFDARIPASIHISYHLSYRYLIFEVFRI